MHILSLDSETIMPNASRAAHAQIDVVVRLEKHCPRCSLKLVDDFDLEQHHLSGQVITVRRKCACYLQGAQEYADPSTERFYYLDLMLAYRADQHGTQQGSSDADKQNLWDLRGVVSKGSTSKKTEQFQRFSLPRDRK